MKRTLDVTVLNAERTSQELKLRRAPLETLASYT